MAAVEHLFTIIFGILCMTNMSTAEDCNHGTAEASQIAELNGSISIIVVGKFRYEEFELRKDSKAIGYYFLDHFRPIGDGEKIIMKLISDTTFNITLIDIKTSDSGYYTLLHLFDEDEARICWALYTLDMIERYSTTKNNFIEAGTRIYIDELPYLPDDVKTRMNVTTSWYFNNDIIGSDGLIVRPEMNKRNITYIIKDQKNNTAEFNLILNVAYVRNIRIPTRKLMLAFGETVPEVTCMADCNPACMFHWYRDNVTISNIPTLSLGRASFNVSGEYFCVATNTEGHSSTKAYLYIYYHDAGIRIFPGDSFHILTGTNDVQTIDCVFHCYPLCTFEWLKNGIVLQHSPSLYVEQVPQSRTGLYTCRAYQKEMKRIFSKSLHIYDHYEVEKASDELRMTNNIQTGVMVFQSILIAAMVSYLLKQRFGFCSLSSFRNCHQNQKANEQTKDIEEQTNNDERKEGMYLELEPRTTSVEAYDTLETGAHPVANNRTETYENMNL